MSRQRYSPSLWKRNRRRAQICIALGMLYSCHQNVSAFSNVISGPLLGKATKVYSGTWRLSRTRLGVTRDGTSHIMKTALQPGQDFPPSNRAAFREIKRTVAMLLEKRDYKGVKDIIMGMLEFLIDESDAENDERKEISAAIDDALQAVYSSAFAPPFNKGKSSRSRISLGVELLFTQLSSTALLSPHNSIPKPVLLSALKALTGLNEVVPMRNWNGKLNNTDAAYRILQRLVTGVGVRNVNSGTMTRLYEKDFNLVLNAYTNIGRMDMAHRIVALQERTPNAPALSPVAFSILLKGYGRLGDIYNVDTLLGHAETSGVEIDTIMLNSLIDAYINCGDFDRANDVFNFMKRPSPESNLAIEHPILFDPDRCPSPNKRTYNTILKGLASRGLFTEARIVADEMETKKLWDHVTTNTLVQAAVKAHDFDAVEQILAAYTVSGEYNTESHPNAEAYTNAVDGFAKNGEMAKAAHMLKEMKSRGVDPNEFTYTCLIGALANNKKVDQATKMLKYMSSIGFKPRVVTYNAFISGLAHRDRSIDGDVYDRYIDEAIKLLKEMVSEGVKPNAVTVSVLVRAFGKCDHPRISEALALVYKFEKDGIIPKNHIRVSTAVIQALGAAGDLSGASEQFHSLLNPDAAAINALLDVYTKQDKDASAVEIFQQYFQGSNPKEQPDVVSYSIIIASALKALSYDGCKEARRLYEEMKYRQRIKPDTALVDIILKAMVEYGKNGNLLASDVRFVASVLRDAERLDWCEGQLERRKRAVQTIMTGRIAGTWEEESELYGLSGVDDYEDKLFKKYGWNKVDSGFRLWGETLRRDARKTRQSDRFLQSKGWNDVDSGFRIL